MPLRALRRDFGASGFTLVELMVVIVIAAALLAIAIPTYQTSIRKSRRVDAKTALLDLASREERYFAINTAYTNSATNLGYGSWGPVGSNYYTLAAPTYTNSAGAAGAGVAFTVSVTTINSQAADTACQYFSVDNLGVQRAGNGAPGVTQSPCWQ
jgi:type IV pilus assembly protein PilE